MNENLILKKETDETKPVSPIKEDSKDSTEKIRQELLSLLDGMSTSYLLSIL